MGNSEPFNRRAYFIKVLEEKKNISTDKLLPYIPEENKNLGGMFSLCILYL